MWRLALSPRWMVWHVLTLGAMATCGWLAAWQWSRAGSAMGSALNVGYGLQWPVFALFFGFMWWRLLRMEATRGPAGGPAPAPEVVAVPRRAPQEGRSVAVDHPAALSTGPGPGARSGSPFGPRPAGAAPPQADAELADYNRALAALAAQHDRGGRDRPASSTGADTPHPDPAP